MRIEVCMISARGLGRLSSPWKPQWFAVGWVDPNNKYCTRIDSSGSSNPTWNTKFSAAIAMNSVLTVEVYSRDPFFLREKLRGFAAVDLAELLSKAGELSVEPQAASFPLKKKKKSSKPRGFIDVSVRVSEYDGLSEFSLRQPAGEKKNEARPNYQHNQEPESGGYQNLPLPETEPRRPTPPPPPPPANTGFIPSFFPGVGRLPEKTAYGGSPGSEAAALAAGAVIFGDDFLWTADFRAK